MSVYGLPNTAQWISINRPAHEPVMIIQLADDDHEYLYAPASGTLYRTLRDAVGTLTYWHKLDNEHTLKIYSGAEGNGHFKHHTGWVDYSKDDE